jgi:coenzyme F420-reducing hydrogenase alpha subunit
LRTRRDEFAASIELIGWLREQLADAQHQSAIAPLPASVRASSGVGIVEGWRGTIVHRVEISDRGRLTRVKIVDPSFFNWPALPVALADTMSPTSRSPKRASTSLTRERTPDTAMALKTCQHCATSYEINRKETRACDIASTATPGASFCRTHWLCTRTW